ncbi:CoA transferase [Methylobacterium sp. NEAU 140]|uniref:CaiB/BaiF CoA transferase family protein n=1 Tax=Methylobacterium sp. NEAU 140 TaxID=3064945 RepID=UPI0027322C27|nr:CoA transferase [Methylobacterium sp. NEAU 140]MDP4026162.1 CoA transferase [Methylobacterium sp. NEAU 140]
MSPTQPLSGYRILDLTVMTAGPVGTMMMGDLGADVIKVEEIRDGELSRNMGTVFAAGESSMFLSQNRNKRSIRLDLKQPAGRDAFLEMARSVDVVTENFRPGTVDRLGIGYEAVRAVNPDIVYASVSAFGQTGPYAHLPANDPVVQALSGVMAMTGEADGAPVRIGTPYPDFGAAALLAFSVSAALLHRERTGEGQRIEMSLLAGTIFSSIPRDGETLRTGAAPPRLGSAHPTFVPYRNYRGGDGAFFFLACFTEKFWGALCRCVDRPDLAIDERFASNVARCANRTALDTELEAIFASRPTSEWLEMLGKANVPAAPIQDLHQTLRHDPQVRHNGMVVELEHPTAGPVEMLALPVDFRGTPAQYRRAAPRLGEHTEEILAEFGFDRGRIEGLRRDGVVAGLADATKPAKPVDL